MEALSYLEKWYSERCDSQWEHSYGVTVDTLDNPGWSLRFDLRGTHKESSELDWTAIDRTEDDWIRYRVHKKQFEIACGPLNLTEAVRIFRDWFDGTR